MARLLNDQEEAYARGRRPGLFYVSQRFPEGGARNPVPDGHPCRIACQVVDAHGEVAFESDRAWEVVLRTTPTRQQVKALFFEDTRKIQRLVIQRFGSNGAPIGPMIATFEGNEVQELAAFLALINSSVLELTEHKDGIRLLPQGVEALLLDGASQRQLFDRYAPVFAELFEADVDSPELIAFARRRRQVELFRDLLHDEKVFAERQAALQRTGRLHGAEHVWQDFFDANKWIFGSSLAVQYLHSWDPAKLEQTTVGSSVFSHGKRPDALLRTAGALSALVFVEIKTHKTDLLHAEKSAYRTGSWRISPAVAGGLAQCQASVDETIDAVPGSEVIDTDSRGFRTGKRALLCRPRSILVVGSLSEFVDAEGTNLDMFQSFERFRRGVKDPEIVTFDEVYERARLVLSMNEHESGSQE